MLIQELCEGLSKRKIEYALVGGYALALHGLVRTTMDVDLVVGVSEKELVAMEGLLRDLGLVSRLPIRATEVAKFREEYIRERNLIAWSFVDPKNQTRQVDVLIRYVLTDVKVKRIKWGGLEIRVADLPSLLKMKLEAARPQDLLDVEKIREKIKADKR
jgi:hypothetical protein